MYETTPKSPTRADVRVGYKVNMGNYESLDLSFSIADDARPGESAQALFDRVYGFVFKQVMEKVAEARG